MLENVFSVAMRRYSALNDSLLISKLLFSLTCLQFRMLSMDPFDLELKITLKRKEKNHVMRLFHSLFFGSFLFVGFVE